MIVFDEKGIELIMPLNRLEDIHFLQTAIVRVIREQSNGNYADSGEEIINPLIGLLEATLFSWDEMKEIEAFYKAKNKSKGKRKAA